MIGRPELSRLAAANGVPERAQEKDYVLAWLVAARAMLGPETFVFKGGTALRRCYFPGYRYSEDLDFTAAEELSRDAIRGVLANWCSWVRERTGIEADLVAPNDGGRGGTGFIRYVGPLRANDGRDIKVDVAIDETVREMPERRALLSEYSDLDGSAFLVDVYSLIEVWAEKSRSLLQRSEPRDLYDLDRLLLDDQDLPAKGHDLFTRKAVVKRLDPGGLLERLENREKTLERMWNDRLRSQVRDLPEFGGVWRRVVRGYRQAGY